MVPYGYRNKTCRKSIRFVDRGMEGRPSADPDSFGFTTTESAGQAASGRSFFWHLLVYSRKAGSMS